MVRWIRAWRMRGPLRYRNACLNWKRVLWSRFRGPRSGNDFSVVSSRVRWHPAALQDALSARDAVAAVTETPEVSPLRSMGCRHYAFPSRYPFTLVYRLTPEIEIVAVAH